MAFDLKAATADASFDWSTAFLFGADSQSATDPSIYASSTILTNLLANARTWAATQTITPAADTNALAVSSFSLTGTNAQSIIDIAGTWNTTGTPTAIKMNVTDTASNAAALLMDLQVGGTSKFRVNKSGEINVGQGSISSTAIQFGSATSGFLSNSADVTYVRAGAKMAYLGFLRLSLNSTGYFGWTSSGSADGTVDTFLYRDAANTLALRNSTNAQAFNVYNTYTDASNYERGIFSWSHTTNRLVIGTQHLGSGSARDVTIQYGNFSVSIISIGSTTGAITLGGTIGSIYTNTLRLMGNGGVGAALVTVGAANATSPALKASSTTLQMRLGDDSDFAPMAAALLQTGKAYTVATLPTAATGMIARVTDASAPSIGSTVSGGGAAFALVVYNGSNWTVIGV